MAELAGPATYELRADCARVRGRRAEHPAKAPIGGISDRHALDTRSEAAERRGERWNHFIQSVDSEDTVFGDE